MTIIKKNVSDGTIYEFLMTSEGRKTMLFTEKTRNTEQYVYIPVHSKYSVVGGDICKQV